MLSRRYFGLCKRSILAQKTSDQCRIRQQSNQVTKRFSTSPNAGDNGRCYVHMPGEETLRHLTFGNVTEDAANAWPDRKAIISVEENISITFSELLQEVDILAASLLELGLEAGDRLGLWAPNISQWAIIKLAACRIGLRLVTINPVYQMSEIEFCLNKVGVKALFCLDKFKTQNYHAMLKGIIPDLGKNDSKIIDSSRLPALKSIVIISEEKYPGTYNYSDLLSSSNPTLANQIAHMQNDIQPDAGCNIQFTSGTTGSPKAVEMSHSNLINNGVVIGKRIELHRQQDLVCLQLPFFHVFGLVSGIVSSIVNGCTMVLPSIGYDPKKSLQAIHSHNCSIICGTPTMYVDLLNVKRQVGDGILINSRIAMTGGASISPHLVTTITKEFNVKDVKSAFGMTENSGTSFLSRPEDTSEVTAQTVGCLLDHMEAKVIDQNGRAVKWGETGELCVRGYPVMLGYWEDEAKTKEVLGPDRWLRTGDQFKLSENGYGKIVGRLKELIIRGGENVYPVEVEDFLNTHPDILEAQVLGISDERLGEEVCAAVRLREGAKLTEQDLKKYCSGKIAPFKIPKILKVMDSFPRTTSGKIQKFKIKQMIENTSE